MTDQLRHSATLVEVLGSALRRGDHGLNVAPGLLKQVLEGGYWRDFTTKRQERVHHDRFQSFVETPPLRGLGASMDLVDRIVGTKDPDLLRMLREAKKGKPGRPTDAPVIPCDSQGIYGGADYQADRLARESPELYERVRAGEMSINAASIEAGFRPRRISIRLDRVDSIARTLRERLTEEQLHDLSRLLRETP